MYNNNNNLRLL